MGLEDVGFVIFLMGLEDVGLVSIASSYETTLSSRLVGIG